MSGKNKHQYLLPLEVVVLEQEEMLTSNEIFSYLAKRPARNYNPYCFLYHGIRFDESLSKLEGIFQSKAILASKHLKNSSTYSDNANKGEYVSLLTFKEDRIEFDVFINENISLLISPFCNAYLSKYISYYNWERIANVPTKNIYSYLKDEYMCKDIIPFHFIKAIGFPYNYYMNKHGQEYTEKKLSSLKKLMRKYEIDLDIVDTSNYNKTIIEKNKIITKKEVLNNILMEEDVVASINKNIDILLELIPEIKDTIGFEHNHPHHHLNVWDHTLLALSKSPLDFETRVALLLHDIGKPHSYQEGEVRHFKGHPKVSYEMSLEILKRLDFTDEEIEKLANLILYHDDKLTLKEMFNDKELSLKRFDVQYCDTLAHHPDKLELRIIYLLKINEILNTGEKKEKYTKKLLPLLNKKVR